MMRTNKRAARTLCEYWADKAALNPADREALAADTMKVLAKLGEFDAAVIGIITRRIAALDTKQLWTYLKPNFDMPDTENFSEAVAAMHCLSIDEVDVLLVCGGLGADFSRANALLGTQNSTENYLLALGHLESLLTFKDDADERLRLEFAVVIVKEMYESVIESAPKPKTVAVTFRGDLKVNVLRAVIVFAAVDIAAVLLLGGIFLFFEKSDGGAPVTGYANSVIDSAMGLLYEAEYLPSGYHKFTHSVSAMTTRIVYKNDSGQQILFTQQVSEKKITGFDKSSDTEILAIDNRKAAVSVSGGSISVYWYSGYYAYTLTGAAPKEEMIETARGMQISRPEFPFKYDEYLAAENDDIVVGKVTHFDANRINAFYENYKSGVDDTLRICEKVEDGIIASTVKLAGGQVYYTKDVRRSNYSDQVFEYGTRVQEIQISNTGGRKYSLMLTLEDASIPLITWVV